MSVITLQEALAQDAYDWLAKWNPTLLEAIRYELEQGKTPADIRIVVSMSVGPDRQALAIRCYQAAMWISEYEEE